MAPGQENFKIEWTPFLEQGVLPKAVVWLLRCQEEARGSPAVRSLILRPRAWSPVCSASVPASVPQLLRACLPAPSFSFELTGESLQRLVLPPRTAGKSRNRCLGWGWREAPAACKSIYRGVLRLYIALGKALRSSMLQKVRILIFASPTSLVVIIGCATIFFKCRSL